VVGNWGNEAGNQLIQQKNIQSSPFKGEKLFEIWHASCSLSRSREKMTQQEKSRQRDKEDAMKNATGIGQEMVGTRVDHQAVAEGAGQAGIGIIAILAALIGAWGLACLVGGVMEGGAADLVRGLIAAVTGR